MRRKKDVAFIHYYKNGVYVSTYRVFMDKVHFFKGVIEDVKITKSNMCLKCSYVLENMSIIIKRNLGCILMSANKIETIWWATDE